MNFRTTMYLSMTLMISLAMFLTPATSSPVPNPQPAPQPFFLEPLVDLIKFKLGLKKAVIGAIAR